MEPLCSEPIAAFSVCDLGRSPIISLSLCPSVCLSVCLSGSLCACVCLCVYAYVHVYVRTRMHTHAHEWKPENNLTVISQTMSTLFFRSGVSHLA